MGWLAVREQDPLNGIEDEFAEFVFYSRVLRYFDHVKTMSELCPNEYKTALVCFFEDVYELDQCDFWEITRSIVDLKLEGNKKSS